MPALAQVRSDPDLDAKLSEACRGLLGGLLQKRPGRRLGSVGGAAELARAPFFSGVFGPSGTRAVFGVLPEDDASMPTRRANRNRGWFLSRLLKSLGRRSQVRWARLASRNERPPYVPDVDGDADTGHFDAEFTEETPRDSDYPAGRNRNGGDRESFFDLFSLNFSARRRRVGSGDESNEFANFSYNPSSQIDG